jgi:thiamine phosphate synthase YjbQ (UPF0047 family)
VEVLEYMNVITKIIQLKLSKEDDIIDVTKQTSDALKESELNNGIVNVFVAGSTAAVTTIEYEPGLRYDFPKMLSRIAPKDIHIVMMRLGMMETVIRMCVPRWLGLV